MATLKSVDDLQLDPNGENRKTIFRFPDRIVEEANDAFKVAMFFPEQVMQFYSYKEMKFLGQVKMPVGPGNLQIMSEHLPDDLDEETEQSIRKIMEALPVYAKRKFDGDDDPVWVNLMPGKDRAACLFMAFCCVHGHKGKDAVKEVKEVFATINDIPIDKAGESGNPPFMELLIRFKDGTEWKTDSRQQPEWFDVNDEAALKRLPVIANECAQMVTDTMTLEQDN